MKAMILAAGRGERMRPLTDHHPKPLLQVGGKALIEHHIEKLAKAGIVDIVINHAWLGQQIEDKLGDGQQYGVNIQYSAEESGGLETAGGIIKALPLLGGSEFIVINGDIWCDLDYHLLTQIKLKNEQLAHLLLVDNPAHNSTGDFHLSSDGLALSEGLNKLTFSGIGLYRATMFQTLKLEKRPLAPILRAAMEEQKISAQHFTGQWYDIGTPQRLDELNQQLREQ